MPAEEAEKQTAGVSDQQVSEILALLEHAKMPRILGDRELSTATTEIC